MASTSNECQLQLVFQTFEKDPQLSIREVVRFYNVLRITLSTQINGISVRASTIANLRKLTALEKEVVV